LWGNTTLDGSTEAAGGNTNGPAILLNGALAWPLDTFPNGLRFRGTNSAARSLIIDSFPEFGVLFDGSNTVGNAISGCYVGLDPTGTEPVTNGICPVQISGGAVSNLVGGPLPGERNVIGGSHFQGVVIRDAGTSGNRVQGNYIGINASGTAAVSNTWAGIEIFGGAQSNLIGGYEAAARNVISGNGLQGILVSDPGTVGNVIAGNYVGLNPAGTAALPNGWAGVEIAGGAQSNLLGGLVAGAGNVISGNTLQGVDVDGAGTMGNWVVGNVLGANPAGTMAIGNGTAGVNIFSGAIANVVGGDVPGAGNVISGNGAQGVLIQYDGTASNCVAGNLIGLNAAGDAALPNAWSGVEVNNGPSGNLIGGYGGARNFISGNGNYGVFVDFANGNLIQGNTIGLDAANRAIIPNGFAAIGIYVACSNLVGGGFPGAANLVSGSLYDGVQVSFSATNNTIRGNSIFNNGGLAISLYSGGNNELAAPALSAAVVSTNTVVSGSFSGNAGESYQLDFYADAPSAASAESMTYLGSTAVTGSGGTAAFIASLGARLPAGRAVTASITDAAGNTSQLSTGISATMTSTPGDGIPDAWRALYFGGDGTTTNSESDALADPDGDGLDNYQEFLAGTNPTNAASAFRLQALDPQVAGQVVSMDTVSGTIYRILTCSDLAAGRWAILADQVQGNGTNLDFGDPAAAVTPDRFYRAQVLW
jgi:titin